MPLPTEGLTPQSTKEEIKAAVDAAIRQLVSEGKSQEEAAAIALQSARDRTSSAGGVSPPGGLNPLQTSQPVGRSRLRLRAEGRIGGRV